MFMQAGFAIVETGLTRAKCESHHDDEFHGVWLWSVRLWVCGFAIQMGGAGVRLCWAARLLNSEYMIHFMGHDWVCSG
jgi:Amt family ammonium transporter